MTIETSKIFARKPDVIRLDYAANVVRTATNGHPDLIAGRTALFDPRATIANLPPPPIKRELGAGADEILLSPPLVTDETGDLADNDADGKWRFPPSRLAAK